MLFRCNKRPSGVNKKSYIMLNMNLNTILRCNNNGLWPINAILLIVIVGVFGCSRSEFVVKSVNVKIPVFSEIIYDSIEVIVNSNSKQILVPLEKLLGDTLEMNLRIEKQHFPSPRIEAKVFMNSCKIQRIQLSYSISTKSLKTYTANPIEFIGTCQRHYELRTLDYRSDVMNRSTIDTLTKHGFDLKIGLPEDEQSGINSINLITNQNLKKNHYGKSK